MHPLHNLGFHFRVLLLCMLNQSLKPRPYCRRVCPQSACEFIQDRLIRCGQTTTLANVPWMNSGGGPNLPSVVLADHIRHDVLQQDIPKTVAIAF